MLVLQTALAAWWFRLASISLYSLVCMGTLSRVSHCCWTDAVRNPTTTTLQGWELATCHVTVLIEIWPVLPPTRQAANPIQITEAQDSLSKECVREIKMSMGRASEHGLWKWLGDDFIHMQSRWAMSESIPSVERGASTTPRVSHIFFFLPW